MHNRAKLKYWRRVTQTDTLHLIKAIVTKKSSQTRQEIRDILKVCELDAFIDIKLLPKKTSWKNMVNQVVEEAHSEEAIRTINTQMGEKWAQKVKPFPGIDTDLIRWTCETRHGNTILKVRAQTNGLRTDKNNILVPADLCRLCLKAECRESIQHLMFGCAKTVNERTDLIEFLKGSISQTRLREWNKKGENEKLIWMLAQRNKCLMPIATIHSVVTSRVAALEESIKEIAEFMEEL
jgi:hypothetical protein